jgi:hypothetical protein
MTHYKCSKKCTNFCAQNPHSAFYQCSQKWLQCPTGIGPTGPTGPTGLGFTGATGSTGPTGLGSTGPTGPSGQLVQNLWTLKEIKQPGVNGGQFRASVDNDPLHGYPRDLNDIVSYGPEPNNVILLEDPAIIGGFRIERGTYRIEATAPAVRVGSHRLFLVDILSDTTFATGSSSISTQSNMESISRLTGYISLAEGRTFQIKHRCTQGTVSNTGFGIAAGFSDVEEVYTIVNIWQLASEP